MFKMTMVNRAKNAVTVLLILIAASIPSAPSLSLPSARGRATGCPMHRHSAPLPSPVDHRCCQVRHDTAALQKAVNPKPDFGTFFIFSSDPKPVSEDVFGVLLYKEAVSPATPPTKPQLRI